MLLIKISTDIDFDVCLLGKTAAFHQAQKGFPESVE